MRNSVKLFIIGIVGILFLSNIVCVSAVVNGGEPGGLTPGFWKNLKKHEIYWEYYTPMDYIGDVFTLPEEFDSLEDAKLIEALKFGGGDDLIDMAKILLRASVAAILNDENGEIEYPYEGDIISDVNAALASLDRDTMEDLKDIFDEANNYGF